MANFYSKSNIHLVVILFITTVGMFWFTGLINEKSFFLNVSAQDLSESMTNSSNIPTEKNESQTVMASGHFANNQMKDGVVTWIQGGLWNLQIDNSSNKNVDKPNMSALFNANFSMIRPDGSLSHNHVISNFASDNVIFAGNDIVITGISDILFDNGTEYSKVPMTVHLMGKKVLGLMIDVNKTGGHFSSSNEMFGTLISGIGLDKSNTIDKNKSTGLDNSTSMDSMRQSN